MVPSKDFLVKACLFVLIVWQLKRPHPLATNKQALERSVTAEDSF
jgi:hypothetical protein